MFWPLPTQVYDIFIVLSNKTQKFCLCLRGRWRARVNLSVWVCVSTSTVLTCSVNQFWLAGWVDEEKNLQSRGKKLLFYNLLIFKFSEYNSDTFSLSVTRRKSPWRTNNKKMGTFLRLRLFCEWAVYLGRVCGIRKRLSCHQRWLIADKTLGLSLPFCFQANYTFCGKNESTF